MFKTYHPKKFCREFVELRHHSSQLVLIMATIKGIKPLMDDWISADIFPAYKKICKRYGLYVYPSAVFNTIKTEGDLQGVKGIERLTTTKAFGKPFEKRTLGDSIHIFISRSKKDLLRGVKNGWYPLIIKGKIIDKPLVDNFNFGDDLGYPYCCTRFFQQHNNWLKYSFYYEILKNSSYGKGHFFANPFLKDDTYSYIFHMPCSYHCPRTISQVKKIRSALYTEEPDFVREIDRHLQLPVLVFRERKAYAFEGEIKNDRLFYKAVYYVGQMPECNLFAKELKTGDTVFTQGQNVLILKKGRLIKKIVCKNNGSHLEFPFIIQFNRS